MGEQRHFRTAIDSQGKRFDVIEWQGDLNRYHDHHVGIPHYALLDGTPLSLQLDHRTLLDDKHGKLYTLR